MVAVQIAKGVRVDEAHQAIELQEGVLQGRDCDRHVMEPADMWERFLERPFRHYVGWLVPVTDTGG